MKVNKLFPLATRNAHIVIGGIPYPCYLPPGSLFGAGDAVAYLWEAVGEYDQTTGAVATTYFGEGIAMPVKWDGKTKHLPTGLPMLEMA